MIFVVQLNGFEFHCFPLYRCLKCDKLYYKVFKYNTFGDLVDEFVLLAESDNELCAKLDFFDSLKEVTF